MTDPQTVDENAVDEIHDGQDDKQLPEPGQKAVCFIYGIYAYEYIGNISRNTAELENDAVFPAL